MDEQTIDFRDIFLLFFRNIIPIVLIVSLFVGVSIFLIKYLPKQYKAKSVVGIHASYFQNPLVNSVVSDVFDPNEIKGQRQSLLQQAISVNFIDELGNKFGEFKKGLTREKHAEERELLAKRIEVFGVGMGTFQVSVIADSAQKSLDMTRAVLKQMEQVVVEQRNEILLSTKKAIENQIVELEQVLEENNEKGFGANSEKVRQEIEKKEAEINALLQHFTDKHPEVKNLRSKIKLLKQRYEVMPKKETNAALRDMPSIYKSDFAQKSVREQYDDLLKKLINIDIVLAKEKSMDRNQYFVVTEQPSLPVSPAFPNQKVFLLFGIVGGILCASIVVAFFEFKRGTFISPYYISDQLDMPLLGEIPVAKDVVQSLGHVYRLELKKSQKLLTAANASSSGKNQDT